MTRMSLRITMTIGLAAAATTIGLLAHAETVHQDGFQYDGGVVRFKKTETFLIGESPQRKRLTVFTPQARPQLTVRIRESATETPVVDTAVAEAPVNEAPVGEVTVVSVPANAPVEVVPPESKHQDAFVLPASAPPIVLPSVREGTTERPAILPVTVPSVAQPDQKTTAAPPITPKRSAPEVMPAASTRTHDAVPSSAERPVTDTCVPQVVNFKWASLWVSPRTARELVAALKTCGANKVVVSGFTCDLGSKTVNDRMAIGRAEEVAKILRKAGFEVIAVNGRGKSDYVGSNPDHRDDNRRVVVTLAS